ncbi:MAG: tetratricopeptide repeat protein [Tunicatimonas sp.]
MPKALYSLLLGITFLIVHPLSAQPDTLTYFPSDRIQNGAPTFYDTIKQLVRYPFKSQYKHRVGTSIAAITITPAGVLKSVEMITSLGYSFDKVIQEAISVTSDLWLADSYLKNDIIFFIPFTFLFENTVYNRANEPPPFMLPEVMIVSGASKIREDVIIVTQANHHYVEKRFKKAKRYLDELIRRNPYSSNLYRMRATARYHTGDREAACADLERIITLLHKPASDEAAAWCR